MNLPGEPLPGSGESEPVQADIDDARFSLEVIDLLQDPAYGSITKFSADPRVAALGPIGMYTQQLVIGLKLSRAAEGGRGLLDNEEILHDLDRRRLSVSLRGIQGFHETVYGLAQYLKIPSDEMAERFEGMDTTKLVSPLYHDFMALCRHGLIAPDGGTDTYQHAATRLRMLDAALLFSDYADDPVVLKTVFDKMYDLTHETPIADERDVDAYVAEFSKTVTSGKRLQRIGSRLGDAKLPTLNRVAEHLLLSNAQGLLVGQQDIPAVRAAYKEAFFSMVGADIPSLQSRSSAVVRRLEHVKTEEPETGSSVIEAAALNWEVLPPGELEQQAREIVEASQSGSSKPEIDLARLNILSNVRKMWGEDRCFYARGKLGHRRVIRDGQTEEPDQYLMLILQETDDHGNVTAEHAVAESPIAGPNALYVFRQDVSEGLAWREVMALPKNYARALGARQVKHTMPRQGLSLVDAMTEKVGTLLSCEATEFGRIQFDGARGIRLPKGVVPEPESD